MKSSKEPKVETGIKMKKRKKTLMKRKTKKMMRKKKTLSKKRTANSTISSTNKAFWSEKTG